MAETLNHPNIESEMSEAPNATLAELEEVIEDAARSLSSEELAVLNAPEPVSPELQLNKAEVSTDEAFNEILSRTPETESPNHSHGRKAAIVHEGNGGWNYKAW